MQRRPEPTELMDEPAQAEAYAQADFAEANALFLEQYERHFPRGPETGGGARWPLVLDLGCGPGQITTDFALRFPRCRLLGLDGAARMLRLARGRLVARGLAERVELVQATLPLAPRRLPRADVILSNSLLHHLHDPAGLWKSVSDCAREGAQVMIMDLIRPASERDAQQIVASYATEEPEILRRDFFRSLCAAFEPHEVRHQLRQAGLDTLSTEVVSDRHWLVSGRLPGAMAPGVRP